MTLSRTLLSTSLAAALVFVAPSAFAQHRGGGGHGGGASASRGGASRGAGVYRGGGVSRSPSRAISPRSFSGSPNVYSGRTYGPRSYSGVRGGYYARGGRYSSFAPIHFYRPYYAFRPRLSIGFGLWAGYPFAYPYAYYDPFYDPYGYPPYGYPAYDYNVTPGYAPYPPASGYPPPTSYQGSPYQGSPYQGAPYQGAPYQGAPQGNYQGSVGVQPNQSNMGGLSFEISPSDAELIVDGTSIGTVGQFTPTTQPLGLPAGHHQIEVRASGYRTMSFDVDIVAGQVIPYQGTLER